MKNKILLGLIVLFLMVTAYLVVSIPQQASGSVTIGQEYTATTTESSLDGYKKCMPVLATTTAVASVRTLGSVIVTLTSNAPLYIYDATTTGPHSDHATTSIAMFKTTTVGTYTFDVRAKRGLCIVAGESTVGVASTTLTFRQ